MAGKIYFGNKSYQTWIPAPSSGMKATPVGWSSQSQLLNGRAFVRRSNASHREFEPSWNGSLNTSVTEESLQVIKDFYDGLYGTETLYFLDPFAMSTNIMPPHWAAPMLSENDWPALSADITPAFVSSTSTNGHPTKCAQYVTTGAYASTRKLTLIIPSTYKLLFGWHGIGTGSTTGIRIVPYKRTDGTADTALNPTKITAGSTTRTNTTINGATYSYVEIFLATDSAATVNVSAMIAQIVPSTGSSTTGSFISGKGNTGIQFAAPPTMDYYSSTINSGWVAMTSKWVEV